MKNDERFTLIGRFLNDAEVRKFPADSKFSAEDTNDWRAQLHEDWLQDPALLQIDRSLLLRKRAIKLQCPVGPHNDPGLAIAVLRACSISKTGSVAVQCTQGHWAEYPCG